VDLGLDGTAALIVGDEGPLSRACAAELSTEGAWVRIVTGPSAQWVAEAAACPAPTVVVRVCAPRAGARRLADPEAWADVSAELERTGRVYQAVLARMGAGRIVFAGPSSATTLGPAAHELDHVLGTGLLGLHKSLSHEIGPRGIGVNSVLLAETGEVTDAAAVVTLLASPRVGFVTGAVVTVDGGASPGLF